MQIGGLKLIQGRKVIMSQEVIFIIGSFFGFLISISATILTHIFQSKRDERDRKWELEDKERQKRIEIKQKRIHLAEEYANLILITALEMYDFEKDFILFTFPKENTKNTELKLNNIKDLQINAFKIASSINLIGNIKLYTKSRILYKLVYSENKRIMDLIKRRCEDIDKESEFKRLDEFIASVRKSHEEVISELDKLSIY